MVIIDEVLTENNIENACINGSPIHTGSSVELGIAYCLQDTSNNNQLQMAYSVSDGDAGKTLYITTKYGTGNGDLLYKYADRPTNTNADKISSRTNNEEFIEVSAIESGWHYIHLRANPSFSGVTLYLSYENNQQPASDANGLYSAETYEKIIFSSDGSFDDDGVIASYLWQFGDGSTSELANPTYSYNSVGTYTSTLTITDDFGATSTDSSQVIISETPINNNAFNDACAAGEIAIYTGKLQADTTYCLQETSSNKQIQLSHRVTSENVGKTLEVLVKYGSGNADLLYRFETRPNSTTWDERSINPANEEVITVDSVQEG